MGTQRLDAILERRRQQRSRQQHGRRDRVHQAEGGRAGLERDSLPCEADHPDGQAEEVLQREGRSPSHQPQVPVRRSQDHDDETPKALEMEQDDVIEVYQEQTGGHNKEQMSDCSPEQIRRPESCSKIPMSVIPKNLEPFSMFEELL